MAFRVKDPDPNAVNGGKIFGVRFDIYSKQQKQFRSPYYVLFRQRENGLLELHQHTIPAFIPLAPLLRKYMGLLDNDVPAPFRKEPQDLQQFAKAIRKELVEYVHRIDLFKKAEKICETNDTTSRRVKEIRSSDPDATNVEFVLQDDTLIKARLSREGLVEKIAVRSQSEEHSHIRRYLESLTVGNGQSLDEIASALQDLKGG